MKLPRVRLSVHGTILAVAVLATGMDIIQPICCPLRAMMDTVSIVTGSDLPKLERLWGEIAREEQVVDDEVDARAIGGARRSLAVFDYLGSDSFWIFASEAEGRYVGYATAARIPKADARVGFLYIDELHVLSGHRRQGHARRLIEMAVGHAALLRLGGVRLSVTPENAGARHLYDECEFTGRSLILCERPL